MSTRLSMSAVNVSIACLLISVLSSCYHSYPAEWNDLQSVEKGACPNIAGTYRDEGESSDIRLSNTSFDRLLFHKQRVDDPDVTIIEIRQPVQDEIEISSLFDSELVRRKRFSKTIKEFVCTPHGIKISLERRGWAVEGTALADERHKAYLSKTEDGYLTVKHVRYLYGCCIFLPFILPESRWYKFSPTDGTPLGS